MKSNYLPSADAAASIAGAVLDELLNGHSTPGSLSAAISDIFNFLDGAPSFASAMDEHGYTTDRAKKIDRLAPTLLLSTTLDEEPIENTSLVLAAGPPEDDALNGALVVITDAEDDSQKAVGLVKNYVAATKTLTLVTDPEIFEFENGDTVDAIAGGSPAALWLGSTP